jgi:hypothetical protein
MNWFKVSEKPTKHNTTQHLASHHTELKILPGHQRKYISYPSKLVLAVRHQQPYIDQLPSRKTSSPLLPCYFSCIRSSCSYAAAISTWASPLHSAIGKHSILSTAPASHPATTGRTSLGGSSILHSHNNTPRKVSPPWTTQETTAWHTNKIIRHQQQGLGVFSFLQKISALPVKAIVVHRARTWTPRTSWRIRVNCC